MNQHIVVEPHHFLEREYMGIAFIHHVEKVLQYAIQFLFVFRLNLKTAVCESGDRFFQKKPEECAQTVLF